MRKIGLFVVATAVAVLGTWSLTWAPQEPTACCTPDGECVEVEPWYCVDVLGGEPAPTGTLCEAWTCEEPPPPLECRVTGGGVDEFMTWDGSEAKGRQEKDLGENRYTFGGQAGAPTASQPQPYGEWTHHQQAGPDGNWVFHAGTASAPDGTEIDVITCSDPDNCVPARTAPAKQIDFEGVGTFKNIKNAPPAYDGVVPGESMHWFAVHIEDLGEPGRGGKIDPPAEWCPPTGSAGMLADCDCPDFYHIRIHTTADPSSPVLYEVYGYITGGNLQIHPPIGG